MIFFSGIGQEETDVDGARPTVRLCAELRCSRQGQGSSLATKSREHVTGQCSAKSTLAALVTRA